MRLGNIFLLCKIAMMLLAHITRTQNHDVQHIINLTLLGYNSCCIQFINDFSNTLICGRMP